MNSDSLIGAYIFGSAGRGQQDHLSDLDVLAVVRNGGGNVPDSIIASHVPDKLKPLKLSISWYGRDRLREMFRNGELFAWHLHRETIPLFDPENFLAGLGRPSDYRECVADVTSFQRVMAGIPAQVALNEQNAIYEAGLVYVCLRNIAMAASWSLCAFPDFSRYSAFRLSGVDPCPISAQEFDLTMACRMASQRGQDPPPCIRREFVISLFERLDPWIGHLLSILERRNRDGREH
jgi:hypothetical protein